MIVLCGTLPCLDVCLDRSECIKAMAKAPTPARNKIPIGNFDAIKDVAGKMVVKPKVSKAKLSRPAEYARKNKRKWKAAK